MKYEEFVEYCINLVSHRMTRTTAKNLIDWVFPEEYAEQYEKNLAESSEFIVYATKVLDGDLEIIEEDYHQ